ncbi:MAG: hypothetical protein AB7I30_17020 [Isosphaeraceae bacterium]
MRRFVVLLASAAVLLTAGCGAKSYEDRLNKTLAQRRYVKRLDENLMPAPAESKLKQYQVFVRPPKAMEGPTKAFQLAPPEEGKFDLAESFVDPGKSSLHVLARVKQPKSADAKKAAPPPTNRGDFNVDVAALLGSVYNLEIDLAAAKEETVRKNKFKRVTFEGNGKNVLVYLVGSKSSTHEVALIFEYPKSETSKLVPMIDLALGAFAVGPLAQRAYDGAVGDEAEEGAGEGEAAVAF